MIKWEKQNLLPFLERCLAGVRGEGRVAAALDWRQLHLHVLRGGVWHPLEVVGGGVADHLDGGVWKRGIGWLILMKRN